MAEIVPNRVPCGRREPEPTPPEPKPIYGLCDFFYILTIYILSI